MREKDVLLKFRWSLVEGVMASGRLVWGMGNKPKAEEEPKGTLKKFGLLDWGWRMKLCDRTNRELQEKFPRVTVPEPGKGDFRAAWPLVASL